MRPTTCAFLAAGCLLAGSLPTVSAADKSARPGRTLPVQYQMSGEYMFGCFGMCLCALHGYDGLTGGFTLTQTSPPGGLGGVLQTFDISNFELSGPGDLADDIHITGSGTYSLFSEFGVFQSMQLDLSINGSEPVHFHSGAFTDADGSQFPAVNISLSVGELICADSVVSIAAAPANQSPDLDQDGDVDGQDLAALLAGWGGCPLACVACCCATDLNCDGFTNGVDLATLLAAWKP